MSNRIKVWAAVVAPIVALGSLGLNVAQYRSSRSDAAAKDCESREFFAYAPDETLFQLYRDRVLNAEGKSHYFSIAQTNAHERILKYVESASRDPLGPVRRQPVLRFSCSSTIPT